MGRADTVLRGAPVGNLTRDRAPWWQSELDTGRVRRFYIAVALLIGIFVSVRHLFFASQRWEIVLRGSVRVVPGETPPELDVYLHFPRIQRRFGADRKGIVLATSAGAWRFEVPFDFKAERSTMLPETASVAAAGHTLTWEPGGRFNLHLWTDAPRPPVGAQLALRQSGQVRSVTGGFAVSSDGPPGSGALIGYAPPMVVPPSIPDTQAPAASAQRTSTHTLPTRLTRRLFALLVEELAAPSSSPPPAVSGPGVLPLAWLQRCPADQVYVGVGAEDNFTLIGLTRPRLAFILAGDRPALLRHLLHKAIFELAETPEQYLRILLCREGGAPDSLGLERWLQRLKTAQPDEELFESHMRDLETRIEAFGVPLRDREAREIRSAYREFFQRGVSALGARQPGDYLGRRELYDVVRELHLQNRIVPIPASLSSGATLERIGNAARERGATISLLYLAGWESPLLPDQELDDGYEEFLDVVCELPFSSRSMLLRRGPSGRMPVLPVSLFLKRVEQNRYTKYSDILSDTMPLPR